MRATRLALLLLPLALPDMALAQGRTGGPLRGAPQQQAPVAPPVPALPGLAARRAPAPIQGDPTANLSPNAALFDAINRGDLPAARDAVGRGANLEARNAIGLSPVDAAVDQGRHEIAFYLLSARDPTRSSAPPVDLGPGGLGGPPPLGPTGRQERREAAALLAAQPRAAARGAPSAPRGPRLWANDGGAPQPQVGFLGFDAGRPAGAEPRRGGRG
jgi:hypothetical protein